MVGIYMPIEARAFKTSLAELEKRLRDRGTETEDVIQVRLSNAKSEIQRKDDYDYCVINDELEHAYVDLKKIVKGLLEN